MKRVRFRNSNMALLLDDATAELYVNLGYADILDQRDPTMKEVKLTKDRLIGDHHITAGTVVELNSGRADELVKLGLAEYVETDTLKESAPDPVSSEVPPGFKPTLGQTVSTHEGSLTTVTGGITTDTTTGAGPSGKPLVADPLKPGGAVSEARKIP